MVDQEIVFCLSVMPFGQTAMREGGHDRGLEPHFPSQCQSKEACNLVSVAILMGWYRHHFRPPPEVEKEGLQHGYWPAGRGRWSRVSLTLWFAKAMVCMRGAFHENDGNHETTNTTQTATNHGNYETEGIQCANHGFPKQRPYTPIGNYFVKLCPKHSFL